MDTTICRIELFGSWRLIRSEGVLTRFKLQKAAHLLAYLALNPLRAHSREHLIDLLWPEVELATGRDNLNTAVSCLRRELDRPGSAVLVTDRQTIGLHPQRVTTDVADFDRLLTRAASASVVAERAGLLAEAVALVCGDLLENCYEEWALTERAAYRERYREALIGWAGDLETEQQWEAGRRAAERALALDPLHEEAVLVLMRLFARQGQAPRAIETFRRFEAQLRAELAAEPTWELRELTARLQRDPNALILPPTGQPGFADPTEAAVGDSPSPAASAPLPPPVRLASTSILLPIRADQTDPQRPDIESVGGAVPLDSPYYIARPADAIFQAAIQRRDSIVLVKGPHQTGKTSLLARGIRQARQSGAATALTDLQTLNPLDWQSAERFYQALAQNIVDQLDLDVAPQSVWSAARSANANFERFLQREVIGRLSLPLVWGLDEVDRMFAAAFCNDVFALFRSWHNVRAFDPDTPWHKLTLAISYATEAHLLVTDLNRSPFNVGTRVTLEDFTREEVAELNRRHNSPLDAAGLAAFYALVGGNPYLVRRGLYELVTHPQDLATFLERAQREEGCYGDHLNRMRVTLSQDPALRAVVQSLVQGQAEPAWADFYRLHSAGIVVRGTGGAVVFRCKLYRSYLERHL